MSFRSALITGASSGIGAALATTLAAAGTEVVLAARRRDALEELAASITRDGGQAHIQVLDVSDPERTEAVVAELDGVHGFDLVIANAGVGSTRPGVDLSWADCSQVIMVNVCGAVATMTGAIPGMVARGGGNLVGVSSIAMYRGIPRNTVYAASKAFLSNFLEGLRIDLEASGIGVTDVRPGFVDTPMTATAKNKLFEVSAGDAAGFIIRGAQRSRKVVSFPWPMALAGRLTVVMPSFIYAPLVRKTVSKI